MPASRSLAGPSANVGTPNITFVQADLESLREADRVAAELAAETVDLLLFTTGIFAAPKREETAEGLERDMAVSYLSRLVILRRVATRLGTQRPPGRGKPRVVVMGYPGNGQIGTIDDLNAEKSYRAFAAHMNTVAGNEALVLDGAQRYPHLNFFGLNPGVVKTEIRSNFLGAGSVQYRFVEWLIGLLNPSPEQYAERIAPLLVAEDLEGQNGAMFDKKGRKIPASPKLTESYVSKFMTASEALVARAGVRVVA